jgi:hypothetical protein
MTDGQDEKPARYRGYLDSCWDKHYLPKNYVPRRAASGTDARATVPPIFYLSREETKRLSFLRFLIARGCLLP